MTLIRNAFSRFGAGLIVLSAWLLAASASAQDHTPPSLRLVPADAATYGATLRAGEMLDTVLKSKAWARLTALPTVKMGWRQVEADWANPEGKLAGFRTWYEQPGNAGLVRFLGELCEDEVFTYGGKNSAEFVLFLQELQAANQMAPLMQLIKEGPGALNQPGARVKYVLQAIAERPEAIVVPDMVIGFKLTRTKPAQIAQWLDRLEKAAAQLPPLAERLKKTRIHNADVHTLALSGDMVPWNMLLAQFEDQQGELDNLVKRLKQLKLTIAVTVRSNYVLVGLGEGTAALQAVGEGLPNRLAGRPELAPLAKFADRPLTGVSYTSKAYAEKVAGTDDVDELAAWVKDLLKDANIPAEKRAKVMKDVKALVADLKRASVRPGANLALAFTTKRGIEGFSYDWSKNHGENASKPLALLQHVGGQPLAFVVGRSGASAVDYDMLVRMVKLGHEYFDDFALPTLPEQVREPYEEFMKQARPLFGRFHDATGKLLLPSLGDEAGFVFDAKLKSKSWHEQMPASDKDLALPEFAVIQSVKDPAKFRKAFAEYREVYNGLVDEVAKLAPGIPDLKLPAPKMIKTKAGALYTYHLPPFLGLDPRLAPTGGLSDRLAVYTLSQDHAQRLLTPTPLKNKGVPLATERPLAAAAYFDWAGFVDFAGPWVEYGLTQGNKGNDVIEQAQAFMDILKVVRSYTSVTYLENGILVTHGETFLRDR